MLRITQDECPTYDDVHYAAFREMAIAGHQGPDALTHERTVEKLQTKWQNPQDKKVARWNEQLQQDQAVREEGERIERELEVQKRQKQETEDGRAKRKAERKKPKINDFDLDAIIPGYLSPRPSGFALNKIKDLRYIELDYFTVKGCNEAQSEREMTSNHDTLGLTRLDNIAVFHL